MGVSFIVQKSVIVSYDYDNSPQTIAPSSNATVLFTAEGGGESDYYTYSVSGSGFWLDAAHTQTEKLIQGLSVTIYTDAGSCGLGEVTGQFGQSPSSTGKIRNTTGVWSGLIPVCTDGGGGAICHDCEGQIIEGVFWHETFMQVGGTGACERKTSDCCPGYPNLVSQRYRTWLCP